MTGTLPVDIWSHILLYCIEDSPTPGAHVPQPTLANALRVSSVSSGCELSQSNIRLTGFSRHCFSPRHLTCTPNPPFLTQAAFFLGWIDPLLSFPLPLSRANRWTMSISNGATRKSLYFVIFNKSHFIDLLLVAMILSFLLNLQFLKLSLLL